ncbi:hypothetical protein AQUCO_00700079v1 [Aquilegia coerulea]|uniref:Uncharacterized protein n=1 Tax=Aquilegia coerulea TaxID=218851 RepID=A0A2G5EIG6_AQUCA|nr:hypothetical protein AQUCO_00700079v1 [Aquilegia coerulea]
MSVTSHPTNPKCVIQVYNNRGICFSAYAFELPTHILLNLCFCAVRLGQVDKNYAALSKFLATQSVPFFS